MRKIVVSEFLTLDGVMEDPGGSFHKAIALTLSKTIPNAEFRTLEGQTHTVASEVVAPVLVEFFKK